MALYSDPIWINGGWAKLGKAIDYIIKITFILVKVNEARYMMGVSIIIHTINI